MKRSEVIDVIGDLRQLASVRRIVLDDGAERGVRALLFSTGGGLDFMVMSDRSMDIGTLSFRGTPLAWQSPTGFRAPQFSDPESEGGRGFNRSYSGFLVTCGLERTRQPADDGPHHGRLPFTPARIVGYGEDWNDDAPLLYCDGEIVQASYGREAFRLLRRIEAPVGGTTIRIVDTVENIGPQPSPHAILYHFNLGYPAIADGTTVVLNGATVVPALRLAEVDARPKASCHAADAKPDATCVVTVPDLLPSLRLSFESAALPFLQVWHDMRPRVGVLAIEPCSSALRPDGTSKPPPQLGVGQQRRYQLEIKLGP